MVSRVSATRGTAGAFVFQAIDGATLGRFEDSRAAGRFEWLPDSSGIFIELAAGQSAGPLGVVRTDGALTEIGLKFANATLSPDGQWIAAEGQEGCCVAIRTREIHVAPRAGGSARRLAVTTAADDVPQPISLLGWDAEGRVIYRDGPTIRRVGLDGRSGELLAPASVGSRTLTSSGVAPDHRAILACAADPQQWWVIADGKVMDLPAALRPAWRLREPWCSRPDEVPWVGHELILRSPAGLLMALDPVTSAVRRLPATRAQVVVSASGDTMLVAINDELHALSVSGVERPVGLRLPVADLAVTPIAGGRFFVRSGRSSYLVN